MNNRQIITELVYLKLDLKRKGELYRDLMQELNKRELNEGEKELVKKYVKNKR